MKGVARTVNRFFLVAESWREQQTSDPVGTLFFHECLERYISQRHFFKKFEHQQSYRLDWHLIF
jgi:hypothetical protein